MTSGRTVEHLTSGERVVDANGRCFACHVGEQASETGGEAKSVRSKACGLSDTVQTHP